MVLRTAVPLVDPSHPSRQDYLERVHVCADTTAYPPSTILIFVFKRVFKNWQTPPVRTDKSLLQYDTNYTWTPIEAISEFLDFGPPTLRRLEDIHTPTLIL